MPQKYQQWGRLLVFTLLVLAPILFLPPAVLLKDSMDTPRRLLMLLSAGLLAALILRSCALRKRLVLRRHPLDIAVLLFFVGALISGIGGVYPRVTFCGPVWTEDGLTLLLTLVVWYFALKEFLREREQIETAGFLLVLAGGIIAIFGLLDWASDLGFNPSFTSHTLPFAAKRLVGTLGNSMFTGTFFSVLIPVGIAMAMLSRIPTRRVISLYSTLLMVPCLFLTMARAAWVGFIVMLVVVAILVLAYRKSLKLAIPLPVILTAIVLFVVCIIGCFSTKHIRERLYSVVNPEGGTVQTRIVYMQTAWNMFTDRPITGVGIGNLKLMFPQYRPYSLVKEQNIPLNRGYNAAYPHNIFLQVAAETGVLGLVPFLFLLVVFYIAGFSLLRGAPWEAWLGIGLLGSVTAYIVSNLLAFDNYATSMLFWTSLGLAAAARAEDRTFSARYGWLSAPLPTRLISALNVAGLVIAFYAGLQFLLQLGAAYSVQQGLITLDRIQKHEIRGEQALPSCQAALRSIQTGAELSFENEYTTYQMLFLGYRNLMNIWVDRFNQSIDSRSKMDQQENFTEFQKTRATMYDMGRRSLALMDRDPMVLRFMIMEHNSDMGMELAHDGSVKEDELSEAQQLVQRLKKAEPMSSEVCLVAADFYELKGDIQQAVAEANNATQLDPTFADAWARLAHMKNDLVVQHDPNSDKIVEDVCTFYRKSLDLGVTLTDQHRMEYATSLFLLSRKNIAYEKEGIEEGRPLRSNREVFNQLKDKVRIIYKVYSKAADGERVIHALEADNKSVPAGAMGPSLP